MVVMFLVVPSMVVLVVFVVMHLQTVLVVVERRTVLVVVVPVRRVQVGRVVVVMPVVDTNKTLTSHNIV